MAPDSGYEVERTLNGFGLEVFFFSLQDSFVTMARRGNGRQDEEDDSDAKDRAKVIKASSVDGKDRAKLTNVGKISMS
jgi:predicted patatin/cPLA2 family phospholipase